MTNEEYILKTIGEDEAFAQLEEECAELIQAASKMRRAKTSRNPTPIDFDTAREKFVEEIADVETCLDVLGIDLKTRQEIERTKTTKKLRWISRINRYLNDQVRKED